MEKMGQKCAKSRVFGICWKVWSFLFTIWSMMKTYVIHYIPVQIPYLISGPKCSWPIKLQNFYINHIPSTK